MTKAPFSLEELLVSPDGFGLVEATPGQRAIARIVEGAPLGELAKDENVWRVVGCDPALLPKGKPTEVYLVSAIRTAKSMLAAANALHASQSVDLSKLAPGEIPRVSILSLTIDTARVVRDHLAGTLQARPALRHLLLEEPTAESVMVRHPSGRPVEIRVVAGARAGGSLVARWSLGVVLDEAPRMLAADDGSVVNFEHARANAIGRLLPGAQLLAIGSPWTIESPIYKVSKDHFGKPTARKVVLRATGPQLNPTHWTPERCEDLRVNDPRVYATDVAGEFISAEHAAWDADAIHATRPEPSLSILPLGAPYLVMDSAPAATSGPMPECNGAWWAATLRASGLSLTR